MDCIENSSYPLVFKLGKLADFPFAASNESERQHYRTATHALAGMQKEALVSDGRNGTCWRLVCDEGPWLNGTDLAPFPLGFFSAGLVASYMSEFLTHARQADIAVEELEVMVDSRYSMEGSLLRGTMVGASQPVEVTFRARTSAGLEKNRGLACLAVASSPADAYLRQAVESLFSLNHNGDRIPVTRVAESATSQHADPVDLFSQAEPAPGQFAADILQRLGGEDNLGGEQLGAERSSAVGLADQQKRQVHVRAVGNLRGDGMKDLKVACFKPIGSIFRFLSDDSFATGGQERAPSGLVYLAAGISFCFMTQLGRYAQVAKHDMQAYRIVQDTSFSMPEALNKKGEAASSSPVDTDVFIVNRQELEDTQTMLNMGEQTCYLHAACRSGLKTRIRMA
jgi:organic hydroperoxide reductase OsmC/OhrA